MSYLNALTMLENHFQAMTADVPGELGYLLSKIKAPEQNGIANGLVVGPFTIKIIYTTLDNQTFTNTIGCQIQFGYPNYDYAATGVYALTYDTFNKPPRIHCDDDCDGWLNVLDWIDNFAGFLEEIPTESDCDQWIAIGDRHGLLTNADKMFMKMKW